MGFQDRAYYRDSNRPGGNPLMWLLTGSVSLGTWFGINVRLHAALIIILVLTLIAPGAIGGPFNSLTFCLVLFISVLLHEFGHCLGSHFVGGHPTEIILTPLGGSALADAPKRPWATFITVACGPAVNLLLCLIAAGVVYFTSHAAAAGLPFNLLRHGLLASLPDTPLAHAAWWVFAVNYGLFLFNLWPLFPLLDGGQMLQSLLWVKLGYYRATLHACTVGIAAGIVMGMIGILSFSLLLMLIAASGLYNAIFMRAQLKAAGPYAFEEESEDYSASLWNDSPTPHKHKHVSRRSLKKAQRRAKQAELEQARIDSILAKVSASGMQSLTWRERRALHKATERQRMLEASGGHKHHW